MRVSIRVRRRVIAAVTIAMLLLPALAWAKPPFPPNCVWPKWIRVVGTVNGGSEPDSAGLVTVIIRDFLNIPDTYTPVTLDFSACCDIALCAGPGVDCARQRVTGVTDGQGSVTFTVLGAARDPGNRVPPEALAGPGRDGIVIRVSVGVGDEILGYATAVTLDLNGAAGGSNGTTGSDVSNLANLFGAVALGAPYRGRGDINFDGEISASDIAALAAQVGRLALHGGVGCAASFCASPACP